MRKLPVILLAAVLVLGGIAPTALAQTAKKPKVDLSGTWVGFAIIENGTQKEDVTLVLEKKEGGYAGKVTSASGLVDNTDIRNAVFKDGKFTCDFDLSGLDGQVISLELVVEGDTMKGTWVDAGGNSDKVELERKK